MNTVTLPQAQRLAALGYPQAQWPQMTWSNPGYGSTIEDCDYWTLEHTTALGSQLIVIVEPAIHIYAAPHPVDALVWCVERLVERECHALSLEYKGAGAWQVWNTDCYDLLEGTHQCDATNLLTAVLNHLEAAQ